MIDTMRMRIRFFPSKNLKPAPRRADRFRKYRTRKSFFGKEKWLASFVTCMSKQSPVIGPPQCSRIWERPKTYFLNGAASTNAARALQAEGKQFFSGSLVTARHNAWCVANATSPRVDDSEAKPTRRTGNPVFLSNATSAAEKNCRDAGASNRCAIADAAAARTLGDGSASNTFANVTLGDRGSSCPVDVGKSVNQ